MDDTVKFIGRDDKGWQVWQHVATGRVLGACDTATEAQRAFASVPRSQHFTLDEYIRKFGLNREATL